MNRSYSKIRHIQEVNQRLESRLLNEQIKKTTNVPSVTKVPAGTTGTSNTTGTSGSTEKPIGQCSGTNKISEPLVTLSENVDNKKKYFSLSLYFSSAGLKSKELQKGFTDLKTQIINKSKLDPNTTEIKIINISQVRGSASNYLNGALQPTIDNNGNKIVDLSGYAKLAGPDKSNYTTNLGFANSRWENIYEYIKKNGKSLGFSISNEINPQTSGNITDTGGCVDEKRDIKNYPNPGQYAVISGEYSISLNDLGINLTTECINNLKVVVGYFKESVTIDKDISTGVNSNQSHQCNYATFDVICNDIRLATVNLNNGAGLGGSAVNSATIGAQNYKNELCSVQYSRPKSLGGTVYSVLTLTENGVNRIIKNSNNGILEFRMVGNENALTKGKSPKGLVHGDAPMVLVYNNSSPKPRKLYHKEAYGNKGMVQYDLNVPLGTFPACTPIAKI